MFPRKFIVIQLLIVLIFLILFIIRFNVTNHKSLPILGHVNNFSLTNSDNQEITQHDLQGQVWVANFMFTTCGDICPMLTSNMSRLHRSFKMFSDVKMVSFSVNPENDTPDTLKKYSQKYQIDSKSWYFLTGTRDQLSDLIINSFKLGDIKEPIFHSSYFALVDRNSNIRAYYDGMDKNNLPLIAKDIRSIIMEKR